MKRFLVGLSGASGAVYAYTLVKHLYSQGHEVHLIPSEKGLQVFNHEMKEQLADALGRLESEGANQKSGPPGKIIIHQPDDFFAPPASGSFHTDGMAVVPCSMGTLGALASGSIHNLLGRAADVTLKEGRPLVLVPRESPLNLIHLRNMTLLCEAGAKIVPPIPGFYHFPETIQELVVQSVGRIVSQLGAGDDLIQPWGGNY